MNFKPFEDKIWLSSPTMHGEELKYIREAYDSNWMTTQGHNIDVIEDIIAEKVGAKNAVALSCGTASLHMAMKLSGIKPGEKVFCSDLTFFATVNSILYEGGVPVFIDSEYETWNMDPVALEKAFELYPEVKLIVVVHLYGVPCKMDEIREIADRHGAVIIEDAAESFGAIYKGKQTGSIGDIGCISFNGNKIITGTRGGMIFTNNREDADKVHKWSTQSREAAPWYQHEDIGYNYRMSNVIAGIVRGQLPYLEEHIKRKKEIYERYKNGFKDLPVTMNPYEESSEPSFWLSCMLIDEGAMCKQVRGECTAEYVTAPGKTCPTEIFETLLEYNVESRPIWKPMHMQPIFQSNPFVMADNEKPQDVGRDIFRRGLCLPSDIKMTAEQQDIIIEIVKRCFD